MSPGRLALGAVVVLAVGTTCAAASAEGIAFTKLDDFEDARPWLKGDPNTDLEQKDAAVAASRELVKEGKQSLAFMIQVN